MLRPLSQIFCNRPRTTFHDDYGKALMHASPAHRSSGTRGSLSTDADSSNDERTAYRDALRAGPVFGRSFGNCGARFVSSTELVVDHHRQHCRSRGAQGILHAGALRHARVLSPDEHGTDAGCNQHFVRTSARQGGRSAKELNTSTANAARSIAPIASSGLFPAEQRARILRCEVRQFTRSIGHVTQQIPRPAAPAQSTAQPRRVLIVDDNADCRDVLAAYLTLRGHRVRTAAHAAEALEVAEQFVPEVILLDVCMPVTDGHELCARLRAMPALADATIYAVTALDSHDLARRGGSGFDGHYIKPIEFERLAETLRTLTHSR
jgi:CheY-like chemotaxis protein